MTNIETTESRSPAATRDKHGCCGARMASFDPIAGEQPRPSDPKKQSLEDEMESVV